MKPKKKPSKATIEDLPKKKKREIDGGWRSDPSIVKITDRYDRFAERSEALFARTKDQVMGIQRERVAAGKLTHGDIASKGMKKLVEAIAQDKAHRSSITSMQVDLVDRLDHMKNAMSMLRREIKTKHGPALQKEFGAITNQHDGIEDHFASTMRAIKLGETVSKIIDLIINDIDKGGFTDQKLTKTAELIFHPARAD